MPAARCVRRSLARASIVCRYTRFRTVLLCRLQPYALLAQIVTRVWRSNKDSPVIESVQLKNIRAQLSRQARRMRVGATYQVARIF